MTQIDYPDLIRVSPDGRLRLEVRSPDNDSESPRHDPSNRSRNLWGGFQSDFSFTTYRTDTDEILWQRKPDSDDSLIAPCDAWIGNDGHAVVITRDPFFSNLFALNAKGETILHRDVSRDILNNDESEFHWTSAGPHWNEKGVGLFFQHDAIRYWCFRTCRGRQVLVNLDCGDLESAKGAVNRSLLLAQGDWALQTLQQAALDPRLQTSDVDYDPIFYDEVNRIWAAALWCGMDGIQDAITHLEQLESSTLLDGYTFGWTMPEGEKTLLVSLALVPVAQMSLRCLGREPAGRSAYWLCRQDSEPSSQSRIVVPECINDRPHRLQQINSNMSRHDVVQCIGMRDVDSFYWEYDVLFDKDGPYTVRIKWNRSADSIEQIDKSPPGWFDIASRSTWL
ncbi:MAG: hypothetical protein K8T91_07560 [Planctomycetes bacterium]|nr:hypothetical protein [Planctomycetota bacterium]